MTCHFSGIEGVEYIMKRVMTVSVIKVIVIDLYLFSL